MTQQSVRAEAGSLGTIKFIPRAVAQELTPRVPSALISIRDGAEKPPTLQEGCWTKILYLVFDDVDVAAPGRILFDNAMAQETMTFATEAHADGLALVVHCQAGVSRSAGVAIALGEYLGLRVYKENLPCPQNYSLYNRKVYRVLSSKLNGYEEYSN